jgi:hypothetical protein
VTSVPSLSIRLTAGTGTGFLPAGNPLSAWVKILGLAAIASVLAAPSARAETTRADYVAQAEPICLSHIEALTRTEEGLARRVKAAIVAVKRAKKISRKEARKAKRALSRAYGRFFSKAALTIIQTNEGLAALTPPSQDAGTIVAWLAHRRYDASNLAALGRAFKAFNLAQVAPLSQAFKDHLTVTDQTVAGFGFKNCLLDVAAPTLGG